MWRGGFGGSPRRRNAPPPPPPPPARGGGAGPPRRRRRVVPVAVAVEVSCGVPRRRLVRYRVPRHQQRTQVAECGGAVWVFPVVAEPLHPLRRLVGRVGGGRHDRDSAVRRPVLEQ